MTVYTVGYEGCYIDEFLEGIKNQGITCIADLRKNPVSRKKGFSKNKLAAHLESVGIEYVHFASLGMPSEWRKKAKAGLITRTRMFKDFEQKVLPVKDQELNELLRVCKRRGQKVALLCFEADAHDCHRKNVADELAKREKTKVIHISLEPQRTLWTFSVA